jgi:hypothetical protein
LQQVVRIRNRSQDFLKNLESEKRILRASLEAEKKIERTLRSKSKLDSLFELSQLCPWRACHQLWVKENDAQVLLYLDYKNFYPALLCQNKFADPKKLQCYKYLSSKCLPEEPGILRAKLTPKIGISDIIREIHPFVLQTGNKGCPFFIDGPIETIIHTNELSIWNKFFEIIPIEAIISKKAIEHPLKNRILSFLYELEVLRSSNKDDKKISELKLSLNCSTTTPKINQCKLSPSPFGVHCLPSQIISNAKAILFETIHTLIGEDEGQYKVLHINTDGFLLQCPSQMESVDKILSNKLIGKNPGQLSLRAQGKGGFLLGPNTWWLTSNNKIICELGTGRDPKEIPHSPVPTTTQYKDASGTVRTIDLLHLCDYRHKLNHQTGERRKFRIPPELRTNHITPFLLIEEEKKRSWHPTKKEFEKFRKSLVY